MSTTVWPFLVSRNKTAGYTTVVAPQFICDKGIPGLLAEKAGGPVDNNPTYREIPGSEVGGLTLVFRVIHAEERYIGLEGNEPLRDQFGRPIRLIEGIVVRELNSHIIVTNDDLQVVHEMAEGAYREFWNSTTSLFRARPFQPFPQWPPSLEAEKEHQRQLEEEAKKRQRQPEEEAKDRQKQLEDEARKRQRRLEAAKKKRRGLIMVLGIIGVALVSGGGIIAGIIAYNNYQNMLLIKKTLDTFCMGLQAGSQQGYQQAYSQLSNTAQQQSRPESTFAGFFQKHPVASCVPKVTSQQEDTATAMLTLKGEQRSHTVSLTLIKDNQEAWKIDSNVIKELPT